jgi:hypothetical protein
MVVDNKRLPEIIPYHRTSPLSSATIVAAIIGVPQARWLMRVTSHRSDPVLPSVTSLHFFALAQCPSEFSVNDT